MKSWIQVFENSDTSVAGDVEEDIIHKLELTGPSQGLTEQTPLAKDGFVNS